MYDFLVGCNDCIIENVDEFLLFTLNCGIMAFNVKENEDLKSEEYSYDDYHLVPKLNPEVYRVYEIIQDGTEISIQDFEGNISKNYFNSLMKCIMDDYYSCLNFYVPKKQP